jgi:hypothetical protein
MRRSYDIVTAHNRGGNTSTFYGGGPSTNGLCRAVDIVGGCEKTRSYEAGPRFAYSAPLLGQRKRYVPSAARQRSR